MKNILVLLKDSIKQPRVNFTSINFKKRRIIGILLSLSLIPTILLVLQSYPIYKELSSDIAAAETYLPNFEINDDGILTIQKGDQPLYYQSEFFQLVIDDSLSYEDGKVNLSDEQDSAISTQPLFSLLLLENKAYFGIRDQLIEIPNSIEFFRNSDILGSLLNYYQDHPLTVFIPFVISSYISYTLWLIILIALIALFNKAFHPYTKKMAYGSIFKLTTFLIIYPYLFIHLLKLIIPFIPGESLWIAILTLVNLHRTIIDQNKFIFKIFQDNNFQSAEELTQFIIQQKDKLSIDLELEEQENEDQSNPPTE